MKYIMFVVLLIIGVAIAGCTNIETKPIPGTITPEPTSWVMTTVFVDHKSIENQTYMIYDKDNVTYIVENESIYNIIKTNKSYALTFNLTKKTREIIDVFEVNG